MAKGVLLTKPPTGEEGAPASIGLASWGSLWIGDDLEQAPELMWPNSVITYANMMNDSQVEGLHYGTTLPIRNYNWEVDPNGCDPAKVATLAADLGLPVKDAKDKYTRRNRDRFSFDNHLFHALKALQYGFYPLEVVAEYRPDDPIAHLKKLAPRPPYTIGFVNIHPNGDLKSIKQNVSIVPSAIAAEIDADRLVYYAWDQEGANWYGRSMLRSIYRNWLIKDRLMRVDAIKHERNGMGVPLGIGAPGYGQSDLKKLAAVAQAFKAGESSAAAVPYGADLKLLGVSGTLPDTIASIRFHNEEMASRYLMMFMQLGQTLHGSRSLGESFIDFFQENQTTIAKWVADIFNDYVVERWWDWNVDPNSDTTPKVCFTAKQDPIAAFGPLAQLVTCGALQVDEEMDSALRQALQMPARKTPWVEPPTPSSLPAAASDGTPAPADGVPGLPAGAGKGEPSAKANAATPERQQRSSRQKGELTSSLLPSLPARPLRRQLYPQELAAGTDFGLMDVHYSTALDDLFRAWKAQVNPKQIEAIHAHVAGTTKLEDLATIEPPAIGHEILHAAMIGVYGEGVRQALDEARAQGKTIAEPNPDDYTGSFLNRARAIDESNARALGTMAGTRAVRLSGGALTAGEVAQQTSDYLNSLSYSMLHDRLGGALSVALNAGRRAVMAEGPAARYYASEILDNNTCVPCTGVDGTEYANLSDTERDYPGGGFADCSGGDRCRGTIIAVYSEDNEQVIG